MAESLKTVLMSALTSKATPAESDTLIVGEGNVLKKISFSQLFTYLKDKLGINTLNTKIYSQDLLYSSPAVMGGDQTITLPKKISEQKYGISIIFSYYSNGSVTNSQKSCFFVPKKAIELLPQMGFIFSLIDPFSGVTMKKYLYISDTTIQGNNLNAQNDNAKWVLQYVIGV